MEIFSDMKIADQVRDALKRDPFIGRCDIEIIVADGKVYLSGKIDSYFDGLQAHEIASQVEGVVEVRSTLSTKNSLNVKTDREISDDIENRFWRAPMVYIQAAAVSVKDGVATLTGSVQNIRELEFAAQKAYDAGAKRVQNYLEVKE